MSSPESQSSTQSCISDVETKHRQSRSPLLEANGIYLVDTIMDTKSWSDTAFSLGLTAREVQRSGAGTLKLVQKMRKRKIHSIPQIHDAMKSFINSIISDCPELTQQNKCVFPHDAVPTAESLKNTVHRLPVPKPAVVIGHSREIFSTANIELQDGIIVNTLGEPCDLRRVSQPAEGLFWPFLVVEVSDESMLNARQAGAITAATCNNSVRLLQEAAAMNTRRPQYISDQYVRNSDPSFSLCIHGKTALLSIHSDQKGAPFIAVPIASYDLESDHDVASLAGRIHSIFVWAQSSRLDNIVLDLEKLRITIYGETRARSSDVISREVDPTSMRNSRSQQLKNPRRMKTALRAGLPWWLAKS